jgi:N-acetylglucosamine-6-phosphate deacetylase
VLRGALVLPHGVEDGTVAVEGGRVVAIHRAGGSPTRRARWIAPGFVDLQVNGGFAIDLATEPERVLEVAARLPATGVTAFLPTLISSPPDRFEAWVSRINTTLGPSHGPAAKTTLGARILGVHLEGPFLSPERPGAHDLAVIRAAAASWFERLIRLEALRLVTLAPELPGALAMIARLSAAGVAASLGHTAATFDEMRAGVDSGARLVTHVFNAMTGFSHRAPGALGAALVDDRVVLGLIADGVHADPAAVLLAIRAAGPARIALVTDAMAAAGMGVGRYDLAGKPVDVTWVTPHTLGTRPSVERSSATAARLDDGTLAGSTLTLDRAVRNVVAWTGLPADVALRMASAVPAAAVRVAGGTIAVGTAADLVLLDEDLQVEATYISGDLAYDRTD